MEKEQIGKLREIGFVVPREYLDDKYVLVEADTIVEIMNKSRALKAIGKVPLVLHDESAISIKRAKSGVMTQEHVKIKNLEMVERHITPIKKKDASTIR